MSKMQKRTGCLLIGLVALTFGCQEQQRAAERFGKTFYLDGAGNWGFGAREVPAGLRDAGYTGDIEIFVWSSSLNPLVDQVNILGAKARATALTDQITRYRRKYPDKKVNVIALSAGTGVATWAIEGLPQDAKIDNLVLLGSSLSHDYDMTKALSRMTGKVFVYYSHEDSVLEAVRVVGTIDRKLGVDSIGLVGLTPPAGMEDRVVNIGWDRKWMPLGWTGGHTDTTNETFVRAEIAKRILTSDQLQTTQVASQQPGAMSPTQKDQASAQSTTDGSTEPAVEVRSK